MPTMKFLSPATKDPQAGRRRKTTATPYHRLLKSKRLSTPDRRRLRALRRSTGYFKLTERIADLLRRLDRAYQSKYSPPSNP